MVRRILRVALCVPLTVSLAMLGPQAGLAATVRATATFSNGVLKVTGTDAKEGIELDGSQGLVHVSVDGTELKVGLIKPTQLASIVVWAGGGDDTLTIAATLGAVRTELHGGPGRDTIKGGVGPDGIDGGAGVDVLSGRQGDDVLSGGADGDIISGGPGDDVLSGGKASDRLVGDAGDDVLAGEADADFLDGGDGSDVMLGGEGNDAVDDGGHDGDADTSVGGEGGDLFVMNLGEDDVLVDFTAPEHDLLQVVP